LFLFKKKTFGVLKQKISLEKYQTQIFITLRKMLKIEIGFENISAI